MLRGQIQIQISSSLYPSLHTFTASHQTYINQCHYIPLFSIKDTNVFIDNEYICEIRLIQRYLTPSCQTDISLS